MKEKSLVKPNFHLEYVLSIKEFKNYQLNLEKIDEISKRQNQNKNLAQIDGMSIYYKHIRNVDTLTGCFSGLSVHSEEGKAIVNILNFVEKNPNRIVEMTCEKIRLYLADEKRISKIVNEDPLSIRIFYTPSQPFQYKIVDFIKTLPKTDQIFVDITNYGKSKNKNEDVSCWARNLKKKYKQVIWIINIEDYNRYENLIYNKSNM